MAIVKIELPALGEGITDARITRWLVNEGDLVHAEQPVVEIATDKVDSEIISPYEGIITKIIKNADEIANVGEPIALLSANNKELTDEKDYEQKTTYEHENKTKILKNEPEITTIQKHRFISPYIRTLANEYDISVEELYALKPTGENGVLTLNDLKNHIIMKKSTKKEKSNSALLFQPVDKQNKPIIINDSLIENSEIIEMDRMRKLIADHMVRSKSISPHVTSFIEADVTNLVQWRNNIKDQFLINIGEKLTFTPIFIDAVVNALKKYPMVNASVDDNKIYLKKNINIGIATALTNGNLIVPVIQDADKKNLSGLAKIVNNIVKRARNNQLSPQEIKGGTFTITNLGNFDSLAGTPIINQPEVAILAIGAIQRKPAVVKINETETIGIRDIVMLSLAYDHRIIDGYLGGMFLKHIKDLLQNFDINRDYI